MENNSKLLCMTLKIREWKALYIERSGELWHLYICFKKMWFIILHGEIIGDMTDRIEEAIWYILVYNFTVVRGSVCAKEEVESFIIQLARIFPSPYALYSHWYL